jgi:hypothetical protein
MVDIRFSRVNDGIHRVAAARCGILKTDGAALR